MKRNPPENVTYLPSLTIKQYGRFVELNTHRTPAQQAKLLAAIPNAREKVRAEIKTATDRLATLLHTYTSFDLVGHLWFRHGRFNMETYKESDSTLRPHFVEHATMID
jgi:hypothetical protein